MVNKAPRQDGTWARLASAALPPRKEPPHRTPGGPHSRSQRFGEQSLARAGIRTPDRPACSLFPYQLRSSGSPFLFI